MVRDFVELKMHRDISRQPPKGLVIGRAPGMWAKGRGHERRKKMMKEFILEIARYAGAIVVGGFCMWLVIYSVIFLAHRRPRTNAGQELT